MNEIWKDILGYEGLYQVSNLGRIKSLARLKSRYNAPEQIRSQGNKNGYKIIQLSKNDKKKTFKVHRLVALMFILNPDGKPHVNHINNIRYDNRVDNLEWVTNKENLEHAVKVGAFKTAKNKARAERMKGRKLSFSHRKAISDGHKLKSIKHETQSNI